MPKKYPAYQWYIGDWRKEPTVQGASLATRGFWREAIDIMWEAPQRGRIRATITQLSRMIGCSPEETVTCLREIADLNIGGVYPKSNISYQDINAKVTLSCRRMLREEKDRQGNRLRQKRFRDKQPNNEEVTEEVTPYTSSSISSSSSASTKNKQKVLQYTLEFDSFWNSYPHGSNRGAKSQTFRNWKRLLKEGIEAVALLKCVDNYSEEIRIKQTEHTYIFKASNFIGQARHFEPFMPGEWTPPEPPKDHSFGAQMDAMRKFDEEETEKERLQNGNT